MHFYFVCFPFCGVFGGRKEKSESVPLLLQRSRAEGERLVQVRAEQVLFVDVCYFSVLVLCQSVEKGGGGRFCSVACANIGCVS